MKRFLTTLVCILLGFIVILGGFTLANKINERAMHEYIDSFSAVEYENQLTPEYDENGIAYFTTDSDFKIMQLTDVHIGGGCLSTTEDKKAINAIAAMVNAEKPDLVVITGDISFAVPWSGTINNEYAHKLFIRFMENLGLYWTVAFGNHDSEIYNYYDRSAVADFYEDESLEYCLFDRGPADIFGECNHIITVRQTDGLITKGIVVIDSNSYTDEDPLGIKWIYDNVHQDQIDWYKGQIEKMNSHNSSLGSDVTVESLLFMHIPPMETRNAYDEYLEAEEKDSEDVKHLFGKVGESAPYVYCSMEEDKLFETILELGSTKAIFYGHDHLNNILLDYKGVALTYGYSIDYFAYSGIDKIGSQRGCTVITFAPDTSITITHENYYQDKYVPQYEKEIVDMTK